jgi:hypothetical protein
MAGDCFTFDTCNTHLRLDSVENPADSSSYELRAVGMRFAVLEVRGIAPDLTLSLRAFQYNIRQELKK